MALYVPASEQSEEDRKWMREALVMAEEAFEAMEIPVGSIFVRNGEVIARARNRTNELMNATRHAELEAIDYILSRFPPKSPNFALDPCGGPPGDNPFADTTLYVTVEPCIMCGSALRQVGIGRVVFGAGNERFGGNGSVISVHNDPHIKGLPPYIAVGGFYREEAIMILRRFYLTENANAPNPKSKSNRVLKTSVQPPGVSMHGPTSQQPRKVKPRAWKALNSALGAQSQSQANGHPSSSSSTNGISTTTTASSSNGGSARSESPALATATAEGKGSVPPTTAPGAAESNGRVINGDKAWADTDGGRERDTDEADTIAEGIRLLET